MGSLLSEEKSLEFEDEKVGDIGDFTKEGVKRTLVDLIVCAWFQATEEILE